jgi:acetyl esterase/lipase
MKNNVKSKRRWIWLVCGSATTLLIGISLILFVWLMARSSLAADVPKTVASASCTKAPAIDGVLAEGEWQEAATLKFDLPMFQFQPFAVKEARACELRVMNSANRLYLALRVPNAAVHKSLDPIELDMASLAFCQGRDLSKGDDRKVLGPGFYVDKHVTEPGQDADDPQQDGQGAVAYAAGHYTFEWAVPLGSKDAHDLRAKPGDEVRFNIAFIDRFRADLKDTVGGGLFGPDLDKATDWGRLKLATDVKDDGSPSLQGPAVDPNSEPNVVYASPDKNGLKLDFVRPAGDGPFPLVVCVHGGAWQVGSRADFKDFQKAFTGMGFASASVQYRFAPKDRFPAQLDDITAAVRFLAENRERFRIDPDRVGFIGGSAGAHLALLAAYSDIKGCTVKAVVNMAGPTDLRSFASAPTGDAALKSALKRNSAELLEDLLGTSDRKAEVYATASPVTRIRKVGPAVLTIHGTGDDMVPFTQAEVLHAALKKVGATERLIPVKGGGHDFAQWPEKERLAVFVDAIKHFKVHLKPTEPKGVSEVKGPSSRPFHLGFTRWPADLNLEGFMTAQDFAHAHGDMVTVCFIGGIPWPESLAGKPFSKDVQNQLAYRPPNGKKLFLQISILDPLRKGMAPYWGEKDNLPLPKPWDTYAFDRPEVKKAYLNFVLRAVDAMRPDFLAIGMENNILLSNDPAKWKQLKLLHAATYDAVKARHPKLPVFFTTEVMHYQKFAKEARDTDQEKEVAELMKHSDVFAMSVYPHMSFDVPRPIPDNFFDFARKFDKPIAVSEAGDSSRDVALKAFNVTLKGGEASQKQFTELLLTTAAKDRYEFVSWTHTTDFDKLCEKLPKEAGELAWVWAYTGMQSGEKRLKLAAGLWDAYFKAKYERSR